MDWRELLKPGEKMIPKFDFVPQDGEAGTMVILGFRELPPGVTVFSGCAPTLDTGWFKSREDALTHYGRWCDENRRFLRL